MAACVFHNKSAYRRHNNSMRLIPRKCNGLHLSAHNRKDPDIDRDISRNGRNSNAWKQLGRVRVDTMRPTGKGCDPGHQTGGEIKRPNCASDATTELCNEESCLTG
jgi:hypothetical protein